LAGVAPINHVLNVAIDAWPVVERLSKLLGLQDTSVGSVKKMQVLEL